MHDARIQSTTRHDNTSNRLLAMSNLDRATLAASTDMVRLLFGVPGTCWGSFSCSHARISGRMYVVTTSVLFYSNVLGFERRFCLNFADIMDISLHRTTSLRFELANDEVYVFRSFHDREQVLGLLNGLRRLSGKDPLDPNNPLVSPPQLRGRTETSRTVLLDADQPQFLPSSPSGGYESPQRLQGINNTNSFRQLPQSPSDHASDPLVPPHSAPMQLNRKRALSDSVVRLFGYGDERSKVSEDQSLLLSIHEEQRPAYCHTMSAPLPAEEDIASDPAMAWETEKAKAFAYENTGVEDVRLKCTLDEYFDLFLSDDATHSFTYFQKDVIVDKNVSVTGWKLVDDEGVLSTSKEYTRTLSFTHPIKNSIGPSEANTQRQQVLKRFSSHGMILTNSTRVSGIPAADCFRAEDFWIIEAEGNETIMVSARFAPRFHKRTMLKSIIERSIKRETTEWFRLYFDMVRTALEDSSRSMITKDIDQPSNGDKEEDTLLATLSAIERIYNILWYAVVLLCFILVAETLQAIQSWKVAMLLMKAHGNEDLCMIV